MIPKYILKRNGTLVEFDKRKIFNAINKTRLRTQEFKEEDVAFVVGLVMTFIEAEEIVDLVDGPLTVEDIQDYAEEALFEAGYFKTAKSYILYREERNKTRKPDIFKHRLNLKPFEYPELEKYKEAIQHSYWLHTEFNYTSDIHDFKINVTDVEQSAIKNSMLAIAQVEVAVKNFWGDLHYRLPKPELASVGYTFAESEVRHHDAYAHLLEILGLNGEFEKIKDIPQLMQRVNYLTMSHQYSKTGSNRDFALAIILFSLFIEHVSLFSQFLIIMSFNKHKNLFKGMSNAIEATSKEEQLHGEFGIDIVNTIRNEHPEWFDGEMKELVLDAAKKAYDSEKIVIDWIYEKGDLDFMPKQTVKEFVKNRLNNSLESIGYERIFQVDEKAVTDTDWFDDEVVATKHVDFFNKRSINYTKRQKSITGDDLF